MGKKKKDAGQHGNARKPSDTAMHPDAQNAQNAVNNPQSGKKPQSDHQGGAR